MMSNLHGKFDEMVSNALMPGEDWKNRLYYGDCLTVMEGMTSGSVDLIYLDPPFNSNKDYHSIYTDDKGKPLSEQINAYRDMWTLNPNWESHIESLPDRMAEAKVEVRIIEFWKAWMKALRDGTPRMLAYLSYMVERLMHMRRLLKPTGTIYYHCDPTASHYIKVLMDGVFGHDNFRNEIIWSYNKWTNAAHFFQRNHDVLISYAKGSKPYFSKLFKMTRHKQRVVDRGWDSNRVNGIRQLLVYDREKAAEEISKPTYDKIVYRDDKNPGTAMADVWTDINYIASRSKERLGYRTQKPLALLKRVVEASCPPNGIVLDPFCGCGTTMHAAHELGRRWIGIDIARRAIEKVVADRLNDKLQLIRGQHFEVEGIPGTFEDAYDLWKRDPFVFQDWAVDIVNGLPIGRRSGDGGVDGVLYFKNLEANELQKMVIQVKGGSNVGRPDAQRLAGVLHSGDGVMAGLIVMNVTDRQRANIEAVMAANGEVTIDGEAYPTMQLLTVKEIIEGKVFDTPGARYLRNNPQLHLSGASKRKKTEQE